MVKTPAQQLDYLVQQGAERFVETFLSTMRFMAQGGRTPGLTIPPKQELLDLFHNTDDAYWRRLNAVDPEGAQSQISQWSQLEGAHG